MTDTFRAGATTLYSVHTPEECVGACPIHRPSEHHMRDWPLSWRADKGIFERICPHGVGHPDPDSVRRAIEYDEETRSRKAWLFESLHVHGCDGCCLGGGA